MYKRDATVFDQDVGSGIYPDCRSGPHCCPGNHTEEAVVPVHTRNRRGRPQVARSGVTEIACRLASPVYVPQGVVVLILVYMVILYRPSVLPVALFLVTGVAPLVTQKRSAVRDAG